MLSRIGPSSPHDRQRVSNMGGWMSLHGRLHFILSMAKWYHRHRGPVPVYSWYPSLPFHLPNPHLHLISIVSPWLQFPPVDTVSVMTLQMGSVNQSSQMSGDHLFHLAASDGLACAASTLNSFLASCKAAKGCGSIWRISLMWQHLYMAAFAITCNTQQGPRTQVGKSRSLPFSTRDHLLVSLGHVVAWDGLNSVVIINN